MSSGYVWGVMAVETGHHSMIHTLQLVAWSSLWPGFIGCWSCLAFACASPSPDCSHVMSVTAGRRSKLWVTFNEPAVAALCGWIAGNHPPGKLMHFGVSPTPCSCDAKACLFLLGSCAALHQTCAAAMTSQVLVRHVTWPPACAQPPELCRDVSNHPLPHCCTTWYKKAIEPGRRLLAKH